MKYKTKKRNKYATGDIVLIDRIFEVKNNQGHMKKIEKPLIAKVLEIQFTSMGPNYKLELIDKTKEPLKICYWEEDILSHFDI